ncbi:MAG: GAF domain-containing protein, partial [Chlorobi bacterium]|nr:GAF domain-containing protein [Chlorobiota bacterium]
MSLKQKFVIFILVPVIILFGIILIIIHNQISNYTDKHETEKISSASELFSVFIYDKLKADIKILKTLENALEKNNTDINSDKHITSELLKNVIIRNHDYLSAWFIKKDKNKATPPILKKVSKKNGKIIYTETPLGRKDIFFKNISAKAETSEKEVFISNNKQKNIITVSVPLNINFIPSGVCSIEININEALSEFNKQYAKKNTFYYILSEDDYFISTSGTDFLKDDFLREFEQYRNNFEISKKTTFSFESGNETYYASVKQTTFKSGDTKWLTAAVSKFVKQDSLLYGLFKKIILLSALLFIISAGITYFIFNKILNRLNNTKKVISAAAYGNIKDIHKLSESGDDEIAEMNKAVNVLNENLDRTANYIEQIYKGNINFDYKPVSEEDKIGNLTLKLAKNIKHTKEEEEKRKKEDEIQNWITKGSALFAEIIRDYSDNLEELSYAIISKLVNYIDADQGGIFVINEDENNEKYIELLASYAYDRRKMLEKRIPWGAGLVGRCILERETIFMTKIPENYLNITSGLGKEKPQTLLLVPLIFHEEVYGVAELASFKYLDEYKIKLIEQVSESIASAISMVKINTRTAELLKESKIKSEQAASQEEEIRQNIEEMQAVTD